MQSQASIASTVLRMMSLLLWFVTVIALLLVLGVEINTVVMSGAAFLSAITVSLSTLTVPLLLVNKQIHRHLVLAH